MAKNQMLMGCILAALLISSISIVSAAYETGGYYFESDGSYQFRYGQIPNMSYLVNNSYYVSGAIGDTGEVLLEHVLNLLLMTP